jgi:two-component system, chemotaxis family, CheB/CheR fusion protein
VKPTVPEPSPEGAGQDFVRLLEYLKANRGFDFSGYKVASLIRRVQKRMQQVGISSYPEYMDYLEVHPDEFSPLFNTVLINVTDFFRDAPAWQALAENILPRILELKKDGEPIRCWSAGCASGEEAYTLAILLAEALGDQEFRQRVKIYATDADEDALSTARQGSYAEDKVEAVPADPLSRYFEKNGERHVFRPDLRRALIFGRHDLVQDAAISRLDLLVCRNTLMYFNAETQAKILARFHFALNRQGYLFLGRAETLLTHGNSFHAVDLKRRIFQRAPAASLRERLLAFSPANALESQGTTRHMRMREAAFNHGPNAQVVVDRQGFLALANDQARRLFGIVPSDIGRPVQDLEISYRPVELRSHIDSAYASRAPITQRDIEWRHPGDNGGIRFLELQLTPLIDANGGILGAAAAFVDQTTAHQLRVDLERAHQELETAFEEVQSANEELETTNEELQSTIEELETTNEELQSANEELETMNEELQSTNEELRALNDQIHQRSDELDLANGYLRSILASLRAAVVVLSADLRVEIWSDKAQELWGLRDEEVQGQPFLNLDIGLPVQSLREPILDCVGNGSHFHEILAEGINRRGRSIQCRITCTPLGSKARRPTGVILLMEDAAQPTNSNLE